MKVVAYGERAVLVDVDAPEPKERARRAHAAAAQLAKRYPDADVVLGAGCVAVVGVDPRAAVASLEPLALDERAEPADAPRAHVVRAVYDGPDLAEVAARTGLSESEVVARHAAEYEVELLGFLPGFAYLVGLDERLVLPRRPSPRPRVPAGSIGIAGPFSGVYPAASPGGWNLIARAVGFSPFDPACEPPILLRPGDRVRFEPIDASSAAEPARVAPEVPLAANDRALVVVKVGPGATIQDAGRPGRLSQGISPSGPLDVEAHHAANRAVGNEAGAAAIELVVYGATLEARGKIVASVDGEPPIALADGERLVVPPSPRAVRYVAIAGAIDVPVVLGARATLVAAHLGGFEGRMLRARDVLPVGRAAGAPARAVPPRDPPDELRLALDPGPHVARFPAGALDALLASRFTVSQLADRVGLRLEGARVPRDGTDTGLPVPMLRGATQIATDGTPIVLGPDHPATGGYPVIAVLRAESQPLLARARPGAVVRFILG